MNPGRYFVPGMGTNFNPTMGMAANSFMPRNIGLFGRIANGIKGVNWSGLLSNANKTINVVNQTIPLVKQARPMFNNMRSVMRLAKAFGNETTSRNNDTFKYNIKPSKKSMAANIKQKDEKEVVVSNSPSGNYPNFFI